MKTKRILLKPIAISALLLLLMAFSIDKAQNNARRNNNICKKMTGNVVVYLQWSETRESYSWTDYDLRTTLDSIRRATQWLEKKAVENGVNLRFITEEYTNDTLKSVYQSMKNMKRIMNKSEGIDLMNRWSDRIIRKASGHRTKERFVAYFRDKHHVESIAMLFFINNFFKSDYAFSLNTIGDEDIEFSVISSKNPVIIAQELLHLFGAPYLYPHFSVRDKRNRKALQDMFPNDIMANTEDDIDMLDIGPITKYYISWTDVIEPNHEKMIEAGRDVF